MNFGHLKIQTETMQCAAQEPAIAINYINQHTDKSSKIPFCRMCSKRGENMHGQTLEKVKK